MAAPLTQEFEDRDERRRRLVAARALADMTVEELATELRERGLAGRGYSAKTIGNMERGQRPILPQDIPILAAALGVAPAFFTVDFGTLVEDAGSLSGRVQTLEAQAADDTTRLAQLEEAVRELAARDRRRRPPGAGAQ